MPCTGLRGRRKGRIWRLISPVRADSLSSPIGSICVNGPSAIRNPLPKISRKEASAFLKTLAAGLVLAGVPTYYTVFTHRAATDRVWIRALVFAVWIVIGVYVLWRAWKRDQSIEVAMADRRASQRQVRTAATYDVLEAVTRSGAMGLPESYEFTLYLYDEDKASLEPYFPHLDLPAGQADPRRFAPGRGATGRAWEEGRLFYVRGEPVATDEFQLTQRQREFFRDYRSVAATPIQDDQGSKFGVLTALSRDDDGFFERGRDGKLLLRNMADTLGVVLTSVPDPEDLVSPRQ
jgi:hypothetical protein